jgi:lactate permease
MEFTAVDALLAALPPLLVLVLMVGLRWGGARAGAAGWAAALALALLVYGATGDVLFWAHVRSLVLTIDVSYIVWMALLLYMVVDRAGAMGVIADWFTGLTADRVLQVLLLGWVFTSFLQGVGGFGVPIAIVAPILVGLGLTPLAAIVVPSVGHAWAVTYGSVGSSMQALLGVTGVAVAPLIPPISVMLGAAAIGCGLLAAHAFQGMRGLRRALPAVLLIGGVMAVAQHVFASLGVWPVASALAALVGLVVGLWVTRWPMYRTTQVDAGPPRVAASGRRPPIGLALLGYILLVVLAVLLTGVVPIHDLLSAPRLAVDIPATVTALGWETAATESAGLPLLTHTGSILLYSALATYFVLKGRGYYPPGAERVIARGVFNSGRKTTLGIFFMVSMATVMASSGMTRALAEWLAAAVPPALYAVVSVVIGALGAFMTGSNTNSNAVFGALQMETAQLMGLSVAVVLATQTASASIASMLAPAKIIVGSSTVGMSGQEGLVLRNLLVYGGLLLALIAVIALILLAG